MSHALAAEDLFSEMKRMPSAERIKFFSLLISQVFRDNDFTHEQVLRHLQHKPLSAGKAAKYQEVSLPTLWRYVQAKKLRPCHTVGRNQMFSVEDLRACKRSRR